MKKKKSPKEIIESVENPEFEASWYKFPGEEMKADSLKRMKEPDGSRGYVYRSQDKLNSAIENRVKRKGDRNSLPAGIHTHPGFDAEPGYYPYPGVTDFLLLLSDPNKKSEIVARTNSKTGKLSGYGIIRKTKKTPPPSYFVQAGQLKNPVSRFLFDQGLYRPPLREYMSNFDKVIQEYGDATDSGNIKIVNEALKRFTKKYHLQYKFVPDKEYAKDWAKKHGGLENSLTTATAIISGAAFLLSFLFISSSLTGHAISNLNQTSSDWIGGILFVIGLIGFFIVFLKNKKLNIKTRG